MTVLDYQSSMGGVLLSADGGCFFVAGPGGQCREPDVRFGGGGGPISVRGLRGERLQDGIHGDPLIVMLSWIPGVM